MFCSSCGRRLSEWEQKCSDCGFVVPGVDRDSVGDLQGPVDQTDIEPRVIPNFGVPTGRCILDFRSNKPFPKGYEWLKTLSTLLIFGNHIVVIKGHETRSVVADYAEAFGAAGAVFGALRGLKDKAFTNNNYSFSKTQFEAMFKKKELVFCEKRSAEIWCYKEKPWLLINSSSEMLYCKSKTINHDINLFSILWCTAHYAGQGKGDINSFGLYQRTMHEDVLEKDVPRLMELDIKTVVE